MCSIDYNTRTLVPIAIVACFFFLFIFVRRKSDFVAAGRKNRSTADWIRAAGWIFHAKERFREAFYGGVATILQARAGTRRLTWRRQDNVGTLSRTPAYRVE